MRIHFIAIGGSAMHNLAIALHRNGHQITGSDDSIYEPSRSRLDKEGLLPQSLGWDPTRVDASLDAIILGMHAKEDNPELLAAKALSINTYSYPEYLYEATKEKTRVVIGGSHGKTSITAMILHVLDYWDIKTDFMVGAQLEGFDIMTQLTDDHDFVVLEGDEYLSSAIDRRPKFLLYKPNIALISGIAWDHVNVFPTEKDYIEQFRLFIDSITAGGILIYNQDDEILEDLVLRSQNQIRKIPYKTHPFTINDGQTALDSDEGPIPLQIFGNHNMTNLSGALLVCSQMGVEPVMFYEAIPSFTGAAKRLSFFQIALQSASIEILHMRQVRYKQQLRLFVNNFQTIFSLLASSYILLAALTQVLFKPMPTALLSQTLLLCLSMMKHEKPKGKTLLMSKQFAVPLRINHYMLTKMKHFSTGFANNPLRLC